MRVVGQALARRRYRLVAAGATVAYLLVYLAAIRDLTVVPGGVRRFVDPPAAQVVPDWTGRMFEQLALFHFEPVAAVYPTDQVELLVSPLNVLTGLVLGALVGLNMAVGWYASAAARACRAPAAAGRARMFGGLLGALPGFMVGTACCAPALAIALGAQFAVLLTAVRSWFVPVAVLILVTTLLWNIHRAEQQRPMPTPVRAG